MIRDPAQPLQHESFDPAGSAEFRDRFANWSGAASVFLSFDIDFVPDYMLSEVLDRLDAADVGATFFVTHDTESLARIRANPRHELALHPYNSPHSTQGDGLADIADRLIETCAVPVLGNRFHRLQYAYRDLAVLAERGVVYDCSAMRFNTPYQLPAWHADIGMTLLSYTWEDGTCEATGLPMTGESIDLESPGIKVLTFHPLNVFLNSARPQDRQRFLSKAGGLTDCPRSTAEPHRAGGEGAARALDDALARVQRLGLATPTMSALCAAYRGTSPVPAPTTKDATGVTPC